MTILKSDALLSSMHRAILHGSIVCFLTLLTQIGGVAWLIALVTKHRLLTFASLYVALTIATMFVAPMFGRVPLNCRSEGAFKMQSPVYCVLNRNYVSPELRNVVQELADNVSNQFPGTITLALDGSFPFFDSFPLLPHLSHDDGRKLDLAFYYRNDTGYLTGKTSSPIGYFDFVDGETSCAEKWRSLRWKLEWLQPLWPDFQIEPARTRAAIAWLAHDPRVQKILLEPHLRDTLAVRFDKIRFQGCFAARHDGHIHFQIH
ncbi:hypothetical protein [Roseibium album]|uniref:hypothetical protein n=1 Tax=Roseibium album TaxID=311410 RepID=UPI00278BE53C|nr:hypothetical protein [Roseibium album]